MARSALLQVQHQLSVVGSTILLANADAKQKVSTRRYAVIVTRWGGVGGAWGGVFVSAEAAKVVLSGFCWGGVLRNTGRGLHCTRPATAYAMINYVPY